MVISASPVIQGQNAPSQPQQNPQPAHETVPSGAGAHDGKTPPVANRRAYDSFFGEVGREDDRIQRETQERKEQIAGRTNYSKGMQIRQDEEQILHSIAINAYHRLAENDRQFQEAYDEFHRAHKPWPVGSYPPELEAVLQNAARIVDETVAELNAELGEKSFERVDAWILEYESFGGRFIDFRDQNGRHITVGAPLAAPLSSPGSSE